MHTHTHGIANDRVHVLLLFLEGSVIVFVSRRGAVDVLATNVQQAGFECKHIFCIKNM